MTIRPETARDIDAITGITQQAFAQHPHGDQTEHLIINALRAAGALAISLVAEVEGKVAGHIAFSPVAISDGSEGWYGLGPVSVPPAHQMQRIGSALIQEGLSLLKVSGAMGCVVLGEPGYYGRFGFANKPALIFDGAPQEYFLACNIRPNHARGDVVYHPAFFAKG